MLPSQRNAYANLRHNGASTKPSARARFHGKIGAGRRFAPGGGGAEASARPS
ncbi:MAG: hypothetical protein ACLPGW_12060 [Roseiarcus sp.]